MTTTRGRVLGKRLPKVGANEMVTGLAAYGADVHLPGMLYGKILRSPYAHAIIRHIDTSKAEALEGVKAVITAADMPPVTREATFALGEMPIPLWGIAVLAMAQDKALFHGHPVAAVTALDPYIAEEALKLIEVEYEELPPVLDVLEAMKEDAPLLDPHQYTYNLLRERVSDKPSNMALHAQMGWGDVEVGFREADVVIENTYRVAMAHQGYLEPQAATARVEPNGHVTVWTTTQGSFTNQLQLAGLLQMPANHIKVVPMEVGGAFGGKIYAIIEPVAAVLARKSGRPVKIVLTREEVLRATGPGAPCVIRAKTGCTKDGRITAIEAWMAFDAGCIGGSPVVSAMMCGTAPYRTPHLKLDGFDVITNKPRVHAYRGPGAPQGSFAIEQNMDMMAKAIGMDPLEFRMKNAVGEGDSMPSGVPFGRIGLKEILRRIGESAHWKAPLMGPNQGRGLACGFWPGATLTSSTTISLHPNGQASMVLGAVDLTGIRTSMVQVAAEELGLDPEEISVVVGDTENSPYTDVSGGSRITYTMGTAVYRACQDILSQARARAAARLEAKEDDLEFVEGEFRVKGSPEKALSLKSLARGGDGALIGHGSASRLKSAPAFGAHLVDVEMDPETGKTKILRYTAFQDVGFAINPSRVEAQIQAGVTQGVGWGLTEEYIFDEKGVLRNASLLDYRQPVALDLPMIDTEIIEVPAEDGPYGVRGVGEVPIVPPLAAVGNAIANAVGVRINHAPATPERVFWAIKGQKQ